MPTAAPKLRPSSKRDVARLRKAIEASGLSATRFAKRILGRNERTVRFWLDGDFPIPVPVREILLALEANGYDVVAYFRAEVAEAEKVVAQDPNVERGRDLRRRPDALKARVRRSFAQVAGRRVAV